MALTFPGYEAIFENRVYGKDVVLLSEDEIKNPRECGPTLKDRTVRAILIPTRYTEPSEDDVVSYLQEKAQHASSGLVLPTGVRPDGESELETALKSLPDNVINDIRTGDEECTKFLNSNTPAPKKKEGEANHQYLRVRYGIIPVKMIEANQHAGNITSYEWYNAVLSDDKVRAAGIGEQWTMRIQLEGGSLPYKGDIEFLVSKGTYGSKPFEMTRKNYDVQEVSRVIEAVYAALYGNDENIELLEDLSHQELEKAAFVPILALHKMTQQAFIKQQLAKELRKQPPRQFPN